MCVLDGNAYDAKVVDAGEEREEDLEACALLLNNKAQALLQTGPGGWGAGRPCVVGKAFVEGQQACGGAAGGSSPL
jgi:hypothetical protein